MLLILVPIIVNAGVDLACRVLFRLALGGPAIGLGFGVACTLWLRFIYNNEMTEIMLTIVTAFASYLVADQLADASGVLAVVTLGACPAGITPLPGRRGVVAARMLT